jgi:hypothetical protein
LGSAGLTSTILRILLGRPAEAHGRWRGRGVGPVRLAVRGHTHALFALSTSLSYSGPGHGVWPDLRAAVARHGHPGQADRSPFAVAEPVGREPDGAIRRECLDHMIVFGQAHLRRILSKYAVYYNESRIHRSLDKDAPFHRATERLGVVTSRPVLGGLHHQYCRI